MESVRNDTNYGAASRSRAIALVTATTSLGFVVVQLDVSIVNVALVRIGASFGTAVSGLQWVVNAYALAFAALLLSAGALGDKIGARRVYVVGMVIFTLTSLACGLAPNIGVLIAARTVQGIGAALLMPSSLTLLNHACGDDAAVRSRAIGLWTAAGGVSLSAGPVLGGFLVDHLGWPSIFLVNLPIGFLGIWLALRFLDETDITSGRRSFDAIGQILAILMLFGTSGTVILAGSLGWNTPLVLMGVGLTLMAGVAFVFVEARGSAPMLPLVFFRNPTFTVATLVGLGVNLTIYGVIFVLSFYFQQAQHYSPTQTGLAFLPFMALVTVSNILAGRIAARHGVRMPMIVGLAIAAGGFILLTGVSESTSYGSLIWRLLFVPLGIGIAVPPMTTALLSTVPRARSGVASGVLNMVRQAAGAIGVALFGSFMASSIVGGMQTAFAISAAILALAAILVAISIPKST